MTAFDGPPMWAVVRPPTEDLKDYQVTHLDARREIDVDLALRQHEAYTQALRDAGLEVTVLDPLPNYPDATFVEDSAVLLSEGVLLTRSIRAGRRAEQADIVKHLPDRLKVTLPDDLYLDGGDVLRIGKKVLIGMSDRTGPEAVSWLGQMLLEWAYQVVGVPLRSASHLKSAVTAVRPDLLVADTTVIPSVSLTGAVGIRTRFMSVADERPGANVLPIGMTGPALVSAAAPVTRSRLEAEKIDVISLDISEFEKAGGGMTRLSLIW